MPPLNDRKKLMKTKTKYQIWACSSFFVALCGMVAWNDLVDNISRSLRFLTTIGIFSVIFVVPWLILLYAKGKKTPVLFDAICLTVIIQVGYGTYLYSTGWPTSARWWLHGLASLDALIWLLFVFPTFLILWLVGIKAPAERKNLWWCICSTLVFFTTSALTGRVAA